MSKSISLICTIFLLMPLSMNTYATTIQFGNLLISEVMANPSAVSDSNGEWFEVFNASANTIDLNGITISDNGTNAHLISASTSLLLSPGEYFVLGGNGESAVNGGYIANYVYSNFNLANLNDQIVLLDDTIEIARLEYSELPFGSAGISTELIRQMLNLSQADYQTTPSNQLFQYGDGDFGTPGFAGSVPLIPDSPVPIPGTIWLFGSALLLGVQKLSPLVRNTIHLQPATNP